MVNFNHTVPKYSQLKEFLKGQMQQKTIAYEQQLPSENALARQFGMSRHTVRQAFGDLENEGWIRREQGRGTFCVYQEKERCGRTIAVVTTYISEYIFPTIIRGIEEVLSQAGYALVLANTSNDKMKEAQILENLLDRDIAGFIIEPTKSALENSNAGYFQEFEKRGTPYLFIHAVYPDLDPAYIVMDDQQGGSMAARHLLQLGHREIAGIFKSDDIQGLKRQAGFEAAFTEQNLSWRPEFRGNFETEQIGSYPYQFTKKLLQLAPRPSAICCYNDQIALKVVEAIRDAGLRIPDDISVIGYDDSSLATASDVRLTTIKHPKAEMGRRAARLIIAMVEKQGEPKPCFLYQPELITRNSTRAIVF